MLFHLAASPLPTYSHLIYQTYTSAPQNLWALLTARYWHDPSRPPKPIEHMQAGTWALQPSLKSINTKTPKQQNEPYQNHSSWGAKDKKPMPRDPDWVSLNQNVLASYS